MRRCRAAGGASTTWPTSWPSSARPWSPPPTWTRAGSASWAGPTAACSTAHLLAQTDLFRAGWAERGPYDLYSDAGTKDEAPWFFEAYLGASHLDDAASYWQASPIRLVRQITAPLAIVHSEEDRRCSIGQAEELFMALKLLDREVELIRFPGEGHELTRSGSPVHRLQRLEILLEWFGRWLEPGEPTAVTIS